MATIKVVHDNNPGHYIIIEQEDFDPEVMKPYDEAAANAINAAGSEASEEDETSAEDEGTEGDGEEEKEAPSIL